MIRRPEAQSRSRRRCDRRRLRVPVLPLGATLLLGAALPLALALAACGTDAPPPRDADPPAGHDGVTTRDSAGIEIVENAAPAWRAGDAWRLSHEPVVEIRGADGGPENVLLDPAAVYRDRDGRYIVADGMSAGLNEILVFDRRGRYRDSYGRKGPGPGEFGQLWWAAPYRGDSIAAYDMAGHNVVLFDAGGAFGRELRLPQVPVPEPRHTYGYGPSFDGVYPDGSFLASSMGALDTAGGRGARWYRHLLLRISPDGTTWDALGTFGIIQEWWTGAGQESYAFAAIGFRTLHGEMLYYGTGERFEVRVFDGKGTLQRIIRRHHEPQPVTADDLDEYRQWRLERITGSPEGGSAAVERARKRLERVEHPEHKPAFSWLLVDAAGNLWVEEWRWVSPYARRPRPRPIHWSVFDPDGRWLGRVEVPPGVLLRNIGADHATGIYVDEMDAKHIRVYALLKPA